MRNTRQREAIRRVFDEVDRPLPVAEILELARAGAPGLNLATVYRTLNRLRTEGAIVQVDFPPLGSLYERADKPHHHHFHCRSCNLLLELPGCGLAPENAAPPGFRTEGHELFLYGLCESCNRSAPGRRKPRRASPSR